MPFLADAKASFIATVVATHGHHAALRMPDGRIAQGHSRGKRSSLCVGDEVRARSSSDGLSVIDEGLPRRNVIYRAQGGQEKRFAANLDAVWLVLAPEPSFADDWLLRAMAVCGHAGIAWQLLINKVDLAAALPALEARIDGLMPATVPRCYFSASSAPETARAMLRPQLSGQRVLLLGPSGMGKSTLVNALVPQAQALTAEISIALDSGRHTTTHTRLYTVPAEPGETAGELIDSPGFSSFGIQHLSQPEVESAFPEFAKYSTQCRYYNCTHRHEPGCAVREAASEGAVPATRYAGYCKLLRDTLAPTRR